MLLNIGYDEKESRLKDAGRHPAHVMFLQKIKEQPVQEHFLSGSIHSRLLLAPA